MGVQTTIEVEVELDDDVAGVYETLKEEMGEEVVHDHLDGVVSDTVDEQLFMLRMNMDEAVEQLRQQG